MSSWMGQSFGSEWALAAAGALALAALAGRAQGAEREVRLTVYNDDLGLVSETRELDLSKGQATIEISDVPALLDPTSVHLKGVKGGVEVLEQNFQFDLASPDRILQRYVDSRVEAVLKEGDVRGGELLSFDGGTLVLRGDGAAVDLITRESVVDLRLPALPEGLRTRPTLVWKVQSDNSGATPVELTYTTSGMSWHAEYVAVVDEKDTEMDLSAWVSIDNRSGGAYENATLQLVAGEVHRAQPPMLQRGKGAIATMAMDGAESRGFEEEGIFEYHLYTLDRRTTLADQETKQVSLFPGTTAPVKKLFEYNGQRDPKKVAVVIETENREERGLGMPLPKGRVRTFKRDSRGLLQFIGEDAIEHTPRNEKIRLTMGNAFDVVGERTDLAQRRISDRVNEADVEVRIRNRKTEAIQVVVTEQLWGDWEILRSSIPSKKKDANTAEFLVDVGADQEAVLTYTVRTRF